MSIAVRSTIRRFDERTSVREDVDLLQPSGGATRRGGPGMAELRAEMAANVWKVLVADGDTVIAGQTLVILESMKMEINVDAEVAGTVTVSVSEGESIDEGALIVTVS